MRRRFGRRLPPRRGLRRTIPPLLIRANQLIASGNFAEGAANLEQIAAIADARGGRHAASLWIEAGRARILAGEPRAGMELLKRGIGRMAAAGLGSRLARASRRLIGELQGRGLEEEAREIAHVVAGMLGGDVAQEAPISPPLRPQLPTHCPDCGAPMRPDEIDWLDEATAECQYCGSPVRAD